MQENRIRADQPAGMGVHYHYCSLDYMLKAQREAGYQSIELYCAAPQVHMTAEGIAQRQELLEKVKHCGMKVICVTPDNCMGPWQYAARGEEQIAQCRKYFRHALDLAVDLGCTQVACHSGWGLLDEPREEAWKRSLDFMDWYCGEAEKAGITLVMESLRDDESNLVNSLPSLKKYLDTLGRKNLKPMIDTCAMGVAGEAMEDWFRVFGADIAHMHFVDGTPYLHLPWGDGERSLEHCVEVMCQNHYDGYLTQEITEGRYYQDPAKADVKTLSTLRAFMADR